MKCVYSTCIECMKTGPHRNFTTICGVSQLRLLPCWKLFGCFDMLRPQVG